MQGVEVLSLSTHPLKLLLEELAGVNEIKKGGS